MPGLRLSIACVFAGLLETLGIAASLAASDSHALTGYVWVDSNANGVISVWEGKFAGATVTLVDPSTDAVIGSVTTPASGRYTLLNVPTGTYRLALTLPRGYLGTVTTSIAVSANTVRNFAVRQAKSAQEKALNAFGDRWSQARRNPFLPKVGGTGCYRKPIPGQGPVFTPEELDFQARLGANFYFEGCAIVLETNPPFANNVDYQTSAKLKARVAAFKAANPSLKYLAYQPLAEWGVGQVGWSDIYEHHKDWFVYKKGSTGQTEDNIVSTDSHAWLLDITNPAYQNYISLRLATALNYYRIDGMVLDNVHPLPRVPDLNLLPDDKRAAWQAGWVSLLTKFRLAIGPNKFIFASVARDRPIHARKIIPIVDGIMLEDTFSPIRNDISRRIAMQKPIFAAAAAAGKWILTTENTFVDGSTFKTTTPAKEHQYNRYYLAAFYVFNNGKMLFYHNPPAATAPQYAAEAFFTDWNIKVGIPLAGYTQVRDYPGVYKRNYTNAFVYFNNSTATYRITVPARSPFKFDPDGKPITSYVMPPKSGFILSRAEAFP